MTEQSSPMSAKEGDVLYRLRDLSPGYGNIIKDAVEEIENLRAALAQSSAVTADPISRATELLEERPAAALRAMVIEECAKVADVFCTDARRHQMTEGIGVLFSPENAMELTSKSIAGEIRRLVGQQQDRGERS